MLDQTIRAVDHLQPYLGITISETLNWKTHVLDVNEVNWTLGYIKTNLLTGCTKRLTGSNKDSDMLHGFLLKHIQDRKNVLPRH